MWSSLSFRCHFREPLGLPLFGLLHAVLTFAFDRTDTFQDPEYRILAISRYTCPFFSSLDKCPRV